MNPDHLEDMAARLRAAVGQRTGPQAEAASHLQRAARELELAAAALRRAEHRTA